MGKIVYVFIVKTIANILIYWYDKGVKYIIGYYYVLKYKKV